MLTPEGMLPIKTAEGLDELARRTRRLSQRHRTVLLLVDGKRSTEQIVALATAAGVQQAVFDELMTLGLIAFQQGLMDHSVVAEGYSEVSALADIQSTGASATASGDLAAVADEAPAAPSTIAPVQAERRTRRAGDSRGPAPLDAQEPPAGLESSVTATPTGAADDPAPTPREVDAATARALATAGDHLGAPLVAEPPRAPSEESLLPPVQSLLPDSAWSELGARALRRPSGVDRPLEEARDILLRAVRAEAPIAGRLLLVRIKRASSRVELDALLDEVETRISKPRRMIVAAQTLRHVRHLLGMPADTAAMYGSRS